MLLLRKKHDDDGFFYALFSLSVLNYACVYALFSLSLSLSLWRANLRDDDDERSSGITSHASRKRSSLVSSRMREI